MIRLANDLDTDKIISLWQECFPEDAEFTKWYFKNQFSSNTTLIYEENQEIISMLQLLPYNIDIDGQKTEVFYIYGACTSQKHRKNGYMEKLISNITQDTILIPATQELFKFYEKFGYKTFAYVYKSKFDLKNISSNITQEILENKTSEKYLSDEFSAKDFLEVYSKKNRIIRDENYFETQIKMHKSLDGNVVVLKTDNKILAYCFFWIDETCINIAEIVSTDKTSYYELLYKISQIYCIDEINIISDEFGLETQFAMAKTKNIKNIQKNKIYLNLMFN